jgi:DNA polymerase delta subunit 1
VELAERMR